MTTKVRRVICPEILHTGGLTSNEDHDHGCILTADHEGQHRCVRVGCETRW